MERLEAKADLEVSLHGAQQLVLGVAAAVKGHRVDHATAFGGVFAAALGRRVHVAQLSGQPRGAAACVALREVESKND